MIRSFCGAARMIIGQAAVALLLLAAAPAAHSAELTEAELTRIIKDVKLLPVQAQPRNAALNERVNKGTAVRTGVESRAELTFKDLTITRLGENTLFSFDAGTRNLDLGGGAILVHVPKDSGGAKITTAAITAGITGTTVMLEVHKNNNSKALVLEGHMHVALPDNPNESVELHAGQILVVPPHAKKMPRAQTVDLKTLVATSPLLTEFSPLPSAPLIAEEIARQQMSGGPPEEIAEQPPLDTLSQRTDLLFLGSSGGPAPGKFGPIKTIASPNPYVINGATSIKTDPRITTAGKTDFGKVYRGPPTDGPASTYFFGSQTLFDQDFDSLPETPGHSQLAGFKFSGLRIDGDPTVSLGNGGPNSLVLVSESTITTGGAGTAVSFNNLNLLALATVAGGIDLGGGIAFSNMQELFVYARGAGSNLTVASPMIGIGRLTLDARQGNLQINGNEEVNVLLSNSGNFLSGSGVVTVHNALSLNAANDLNFVMKNWVFDAVAGTQVNISGSALTFDLSGGGGGELSNTSLATITGSTSLVFSGSGTVNLGTSATTFNAGSGGFQATNASFDGSAYSIMSGGDVVVDRANGASLIQSNAGNVKTVTGSLNAATISAFADVVVPAGNLNSSNRLFAGGNVSVSGTLVANDIETPGDIDAGKVQALLINGSFPNSNGTLSAGSGGIRPYVSALPSTTHTFTIATVQSHTAATGIDFSGANFSAAGSAGGILNLFTTVQAFSPAAGINAANFNGQDGPAVGDTPGDGGTFSVTSAQGISLDSSVISATTGVIDNTAATAPAGHGGNVSLTSKAAITVANSSSIVVSSADPAGISNRRSSASGGNITLQSDAASGVAIQVTSSSQLLALLAAAAPGPGGKIILHATGDAGSISAGGNMFADKGAVDIRSDGATGNVTVAGASLRGDIIKVASLGTDGSLTISGNNTINAGTLLKLYADGSNGTLNFNNTVTLGGSTVVLAAHVINIAGGATVTINSPVQGTVFTDLANYQGSGGTGSSSTGTMVNAKSPAPFANRPPLGNPGGP